MYGYSYMTAFCMYFRNTKTDDDGCFTQPKHVAFLMSLIKCRV